MKNKKLIVGLLACLLAVSVPFMARQPNKVNAYNLVDGYEIVGTSSYLTELTYELSSTVYTSPCTLSPIYITFKNGVPQSLFTFWGTTDRTNFTLEEYQFSSVGGGLYSSSVTRLAFLISSSVGGGGTGTYYNDIKFMQLDDASITCTVNMLNDFSPLDLTQGSISIEHDISSISYPLQYIRYRFYSGNQTSFIVTFMWEFDNYISNMTNNYSGYLGNVTNPNANNTVTFIPQLFQTNTRYLTDEVIYQEGYTNGYLQGELDTIEKKFEEVTPFQMLTSGVNSFLNIEIIPNVKLSFIFSVAFGCILLGYVIKIFLGG